MFAKTPAHNWRNLFSTKDLNQSLQHSSDDTEARHSQDGRGSDREHSPTWPDSRGRRRSGRREVPRSIEARNKLPDDVAPRWNGTKKETVLHEFAGVRPRKETLWVALARRSKPQRQPLADTNPIRSPDDRNLSVSHLPIQTRSAPIRGPSRFIASSRRSMGRTASRRLVAAAP
jgi:hypothetical protein